MTTIPPTGGPEQPPVDAGALVPESLPRFGSPIHQLPEDANVLRIGFYNIRGFPQPDDAKAYELVAMVWRLQFGIVGFSELNTNWSKIPILDRPYDWMCSWFPSSQTTIAYNRTRIFRTCHVFWRYIVDNLW